MSGGVQIPLGDLPLNSDELAALSIIERSRLYDALGLCPLQRQAAEEAARLVIRGRYLRGGS